MGRQSHRTGHGRGTRPARPPYPSRTCVTMIEVRAPMLTGNVDPRKEVTMTQTPKTGKLGTKITTKGTTLKRKVKKNYPKLKGT